MITMDNLSELIISTLKELSAKKLQLTPSLLSQALSRSEEIRACLIGARAGDISTGAGKTGTAEPGGDASQIDAEEACEVLRDAYLTLLTGFEQEFGEDYLTKLLHLKKRMELSAEISHLLVLREDINSFVDAHNKLVSEERAKTAYFISEMSRGLADMENQLLVSINHTEKSYEANTTFTRALENNMADLSQSVQLGTLSDFRDLVIKKLSHIRATLEAKRREDKARQDAIAEGMNSLQRTIAKAKEEIRTVRLQRDALRKDASIDPLTGVLNRRSFTRRFGQEMQRLTRYNQVFSVLILDIDKFKMVNDTYGHLAGDKCLKEVVKRIQSILRQSDILARCGGEEFVIIMPGTNSGSAEAAAEKLRKAIANTRFLYRRREISLTISIGVTEVQADDANQDVVFSRADKALYKAKLQGRNQVVVG